MVNLQVAFLLFYGGYLRWYFSLLFFEPFRTKHNKFLMEFIKIFIETKLFVIITDIRIIINTVFCSVRESHGGAVSTYFLNSKNHKIHIETVSIRIAYFSKIKKVQKFQSSLVSRKIVVLIYDIFRVSNNPNPGVLYIRILTLSDF